ncbi:hypothetical protein [Actinomadura sp. NAK00032]|uniref:hypothetical protein n=1 Tax=Actinomadura sp. NAK00032 TaxID=2742128 RepID=UPI001C3768F6|nr:hypothetical protein [Actinomadura sp. NAK00032]
MALTNPKALLLFAAFLPQFTEPETGAVWLQLLALGTSYIAVEFVAALAYAGIGATLSGLTARTRSLLDRTTGAAMISLAGGLALRRP